MSGSFSRSNQEVLEVNSSVKRVAVAGGLMSAAAVLPAAIGLSFQSPIAPSADPCPTNEVTQIYFDGCLPSIDAPQAQVNVRGPNELPEIRGIPCDGSNTGTCIGLSELPGGTPAQQEVTAPQPDTQVRSSP
ncbi:intersectin-EH binding protein Ibp1 [Mycobacterium crocinum]|uniref:Intersectin-EH binding protein Ibp1 n=1 Tax=Mycolicibacterium crocinum TaxID=388459 RepID=A0ABY3TSD8_9MYCO|nr:intersectin-EH binding protein Ibp1 [Mycolicibacterium crocinum]MCV7217336.1 intersectin-EH binding protein Ibp1 [Mycolicibacterium crocinum]ULN42234.1 intersectin-EH binding protein Ibp1 [Mycolicibacterium crocinum]